MMGKWPVIGIMWMGDSPFHRYMRSKYVYSLRRSGAKVVTLAPTSKQSVMQRYLQRCDGFLFPGGADLAPALYGAQKDPACGAQNVVRDAFEAPFLRMVLDAGKPVFCICRGAQLLNVVCGGTLLQDITPIQTCQHTDAPNRVKGTHLVNLAEGSKLARIFRQQCVFVNSLHHQASDRPGQGLRVTAASPEGFIEALEIEHYRTFGLGVQWHPEHMSKQNKAQQKLFDIFVKECKAAKRQ